MRIAVLSFAHVHAPTYIELLRGRDDVELLTADPDAPPDDPDRERRWPSGWACRISPAGTRCSRCGPTRSS
ncbi:hypothetical protein SVIOM74S_08702 [Streptomyces violarus]